MRTHAALANLRHAGQKASAATVFCLAETACLFCHNLRGGQKPLLAKPDIHHILQDEWSGLHKRHGWAVGRYVVMPDHVHFFVTPMPPESTPLNHVVGKWKEWTAKRILNAVGGAAPLWQAEFFDHLLRSKESLAEKWAYVRENPVRAGLVTRADDWPYAGSFDFE